MNIKLSEIKPNPNRDLKFNPFNEEKIAALMASIGETGFWTNVIVRKSPDGKGYEQAYGHHRLEAAKRSDIKEADFVMRDLDENMMLKMMELENQEDYRYCPLSLLESCKAVVNALAAGRIAPFYRVEDGTLPPEGDPERYKGTFKHGDKWDARAGTDGYIGVFETREQAAQAYRAAVKGRIVTFAKLSEFRYAPSFVPQLEGTGKLTNPYNSTDIAKFLGRAHKDGTADAQIRAALDALYLLEVKAITTNQIKEMNWAQLGKFVADIKAKRERVILRETKTTAEIAKITAESQRLQAAHKAKEKKLADEHKALVKKLAEAKREDDEKERKKIQVKLDAQDEEREEVEKTFKARRKEIDAKVEQTKQQAEEAKKDDLYLPLRQATARLVRLLEHRDEEEEIKALARKPLNADDRRLLANAVIAKGNWCEDMNKLIYNSAPKSAKADLEESRKREEAKRRAEIKETE